jgi:NAD(P)-dependent dehydrogenase (short-subunit alcohol dehydrogenase family)
MIKILDEQENYLLVTDGVRFTVIERRNGKFYGVLNCARHSAVLDNAGFADLVREAGSHTESDAQHLLSDMASNWRDLLERVR